MFSSFILRDIKNVVSWHFSMPGREYGHCFFSASKQTFGHRMTTGRTMYPAAIRMSYFPFIRCPVSPLFRKMACHHIPYFLARETSEFTDACWLCNANYRSPHGVRTHSYLDRYLLRDRGRIIRSFEPCTPDRSHDAPSRWHIYSIIDALFGIQD